MPDKPFPPRSFPFYQCSHLEVLQLHDLLLGRIFCSHVEVWTQTGGVLLAVRRETSRTWSSLVGLNGMARSSTARSPSRSSPSRCSWLALAQASTSHSRFEAVMLMVRVHPCHSCCSTSTTTTASSEKMVTNALASLNACDILLISNPLP